MNVKGGFVHGLRLKKLSVALGVLLLPMSVFAAGLGQLNIDSGIGEPLRASIELLEVSAADLSSISAVVAPAATYAKQGIERPASHSNIKIDVTKNKKGRPVLKLKSRQPMDEPFLDMLIQLDWSTGRLLREYTVLLDPPGYDSTVQSVQAPVVKSKSDTKIKAVSNLKKNTAPTNVAVAAPSTDEHVTQRGDTLSKIARNMLPEGISLDQMLIALYQENKSAFSGNNINRLNVGKVIRPPSQEALNTISRRAASKEVKVQTENWNAYRNKLAGIVADDIPVASLGDEENTQSSGGAITPAAEDKSMSADEGPKDVVKLSAAEAGSSVEAKSLQEKVAALQEEVVAREKGLQEAQERTTALEKQIEDMQKLLALKSDVMANAQEAAVSGDPAVNGQDGTQLDASEKSVTAGVQPVEENSVKAKLTPKQKPAAKPKSTPATAPVEQAGFITGLINSLDKTLLAAGGGLVALLLLGWVFLRNRRKKNLEDFEQGIMTSGGLKANTVFGNTSGASVDTGDTSFLTDFSQSANGSMIDTHDVDPIAEAEVYMAYGRDAQAEEILKDAITKEPTRYELHLKLLEMYAASKNMSAFETVSGELYTTLGAEDPTWAKVAEIGIKLEPSNPLYQVSNADESKAAENAEKLDAADFSESPLASEEDLDFSFDGAKDEVSSESTVKDDGLVADFETSAKDDSSTLSEVTADSEEAIGDFDSDDSPSEIAAEAKEPLSEEGGLDFDLSSLNVSEETISAVTQENVTDAESVNFEQTMPDLNFSETEAKPEIESNTASIIADTIPAEGVTPENTLELPEINDAAEVVLNASAADSKETSAVNVASNNDFDFGLDTVTPEATNTNNTEEPNTLDLSGISLDVDEVASDESAATVSEPEATADSESDAATTIEESQKPESEDVDTKLDLIAAYLEMEDKIGAKELLDEVMKEGGPNQRKKAETLLSQIT